jgi:putative membrane protein
MKPLERRVGRKRAAVAIAAVLVAGTVGVALARSESTHAVTVDQAGVVAIFDLANTADIETGQLAAQRAQSKDVREFGRMLSDVHTAVRQQGRDLAKKLGVTPKLPEGYNGAQEHAAVMQKLRGLSGAEFDRAFLEHEQAFHAAVLSAVKTTLLPAITNQELKDFVTSLAPAFEAHRLGAENLEKKIGASE